MGYLSSNSTQLSCHCPFTGRYPSIQLLPPFSTLLSYTPHIISTPPSLHLLFKELPEMYEKSPPAACTRIRYLPGPLLYSSELSTQTSTNISSKPSYTYNRGLLLLQHSSIKHARCHKNSPHFTLQDFVPARPIRLYSTSRSPLFSSELSTQSSNNFSSKTNYTSNRGVHLLQYSSIKQARCHKNFEFSSPQDFIPLFINRQLYRRLQLRVPPANHDRPVANPLQAEKTARAQE
jgi:hypothetical protein